MCGRYSITKDLSELEKLVKFICKITDFKQRYNIALRSNVPVLVSENGKNVLKEMRWGLIPSWAKDETIGDKLINARAETLTEKPSFKKPFKKQRCLIPADGYYEWQKTGKGKIPFRFTMADDRFFCLAGLWECWIRPDLEGDLGLDDAGSWHSTRFLQRVGRRRRIFFQTLLDIGESLMVIFSLELFLGQSKKPVGHGSLPRGMSPLAVIRCGTGTVPHFVLNFMRSHNFMEAVTLYWSFGTQQNIGMGVIENLSCTLPPLDEQNRIAAFLVQETAKIDELVSKQQRLIELLTEKVKALVLSCFDAPETKQVRFGSVAQIISRPVVQKGGEEYTRIGLFNRGRGLFHKGASEQDDMGDSDFFWVEEGDLIISGQFAWEGAVALASEEDTGCVVSHRFPVLRGVAGVSLTEYLFALLLTEHGDFLLNENSRGAAGRNRPLNITLLLKEKIPLPNLEIQQAVANAVHHKKLLIVEISRQIDLLQERRTALISAAVTGQIDVRNQTLASRTGEI